MNKHLHFRVKEGHGNFSGQIGNLLDFTYADRNTLLWLIFDFGYGPITKTFYLQDLQEI